MAIEPTDTARSVRPEDCLSGGGEMGALVAPSTGRARSSDPVVTWPQSLRTALSIMLESQFAMVVAWGPEFRFFYNDRYRPVLGLTRHPAALGRAGAEIFPEVWHAVGPEFERVRRGESFAIDDWLLPLERNGYLENCWFTLSYSPIRDRAGRRRGVQRSSRKPPTGWSDRRLADASRGGGGPRRRRPPSRRAKPRRPPSHGPGRRPLRANLPARPGTARASGHGRASRPAPAAWPARSTWPGDDAPAGP